MKKSKIISIVLIVLIMISAIIIASFTKEGNEEEKQPNDAQKNNIEISNKEEEIKDEYIYIDGVKNLGDIEISNIKIKLVENKKCELTASVKNTTDKLLEATNLRIKVIDGSGEVDEIFGGGITALLGHEENELKAVVLSDITDAKDIVFERIN